MLTKSGLLGEISRLAPCRQEKLAPVMSAEHP